MGKSSFVDGVEWFFTGKVDRIEKDLKNYSKYEFGERILRNIKSEKEIGKIKINITDKGEEERKTSIRSNSKHDYSNGKRFSSVKQLLDEKQILPHSKIESFILANSPKEKFENWCAVWDKENKFTETLHKVYILKKKIDDEKEKIERRIEDLKEEVKQKNIDKNLINDFNENIRSVNENLRSVNKSFEENEQLPYIILNENIYTFPSKDLILKKINDVDKLGIVNNRNITIIEGIVENYEIIFDKIKEKNEIEKNLEELKKIHNSLKNLTDYFEQCRKIDSQFLLYNEIYQCGQSWYNDFIENKTNKYKIEEHKKIFDEYNNSLLNIDGQKNKSINDKNTLIFNYDKTKSDFDIIEYEYNIIGQKIAFGNEFRELIEIEKNKSLIINNKITEIIKINNEIDNNYIKENYVYIEKLKSFKSVYNLDYDVDKISELLKNESKVKNELEKLKKEYNNFMTNAEILERNVLEIRNYVEKNNISSCPVCKEPYSSKSKLIEKIDLDFLSFNKIIAIDNLNKVEDNLKFIQNEKSEKIIEWNSSLKIIQDSKYLELEQLRNENTKLSENLKELEKSQTKIINVNQDLEKISSANGILIIKNESLASLKERILCKFENSLADLDKLLVKYDEETKNLNEEKLKVEKTISELQTNIENFEKVNSNSELINKLQTKEKNEDWKEIEKNYLYYLNENMNNKSQIIEIIKEICLANLDNIILININEINEILNKIKGISSEEVNILIKDTIFINELNKLSKYFNDSITVNIRNFEDVSKAIDNYFENYVKEVDYSYKISNGLNELNYFENQLLEKTNKKLIINRVINLLKTEVNTDVINKVEIHNKEYNKLIEELSNCNNKFENYEQVSNKLETLYEQIKDDIKSNLTSVYSNDIMKRIYKAIEPKKEYIELDYDIKFNNKDEPELYVLAKENKDNDQISESDNIEKQKIILPDIYFSSAQLNTLSLSLFLGDALNAQNANDKLNTIFIDDPIAHFDDINTLAFVDLIRSIISSSNMQIVITTHDEKVFNLFKNKLSDKYYNSKFIEFSSVGKLKS